MKEDVHRTNIGMLFEKVLECFSRVTFVKPKGSCLVMEKDFEDLDYQMNFWRHMSHTSNKNFEVKLRHMSQDGLENVLKVVHEFFFPWLDEMLTKDTSKKNFKLFGLMMSVTFSVMSHFHPSHNCYSKRDFTTFYLNELGFSPEILKKV